MDIFLSVGHSLLQDGSTTGAEGYVNEYKYCKKTSVLLREYLRQRGHRVKLALCPEYEFRERAEEKRFILDLEHGGIYDLCVELHLNESEDCRVSGSEVYYDSPEGKIYAVSIMNCLGRRFKNRGEKERKDLYMLRETNAPAVMVQCFFCSNLDDCTRGEDAGAVANLIAEGIHISWIQKWWREEKQIELHEKNV